MAAAVATAAGRGAAAAGRGRHRHRQDPRLPDRRRSARGSGSWCRPGTRTLQDQIVRHDLPLLRQILGRPFAAAALKGVSNYVCRRKLAELRADRARARRPGRRCWPGSTTPTTGDRAELEAAGRGGADLGRGDDHARRAARARAARTSSAASSPQAPRAAEAELILVNHHLYFADLALRASPPRGAGPARPRRGDLRRGPPARGRGHRALRPAG
jgi:Rad3-related DNA helicase